MIRAEITRTSIRISGHAGYAPQGEDIVCAAVSVLAQTLVASLEELAEETIQYEIKPGFMQLWRGHPSRKGDLLVDAFFIGIRGIAESYPDHVHICPQ